MENQQSSEQTKKCSKCGEEIQASAKKCKHCQADLRNWFVRHKIITGILILIVIIIIGSASSNNDKKITTTKENTDSKTTAKSEQKTKEPTVSATRQVKGEATTLATGNFTGGKDVATGLYDVTTIKGQSGNFIVLGEDSYNEILGVNSVMGVSKVRVQISDGDKIQISGLSRVVFTPVSIPFINDYKEVILYAGTFIVGQDIAHGRYVASTITGDSGNFIVSGTNSVNEILGVNSVMGVPTVTTNLSDGDIITIASLNQVTMTPNE